MQTETIKITDLVPDPDNVRGPGYDKDTSIKTLAASMIELGQLQPIRVHPANSKGKYRLIAGHRRYYAAKAAKISELSAEVRDEAAPDDVRTAEMLVENMQRVNLNPAEEYEGIIALASEHGWSKKDIAERLGMSTKLVNSRVSWAKLPDKTITAIRKGDYPVEAANRLARCTLTQIEQLTKKSAIPFQHTVDELIRTETRKRKVEKVRAAIAKGGHHLIDRKQAALVEKAFTDGTELPDANDAVTALAALYVAAGDDGKIIERYVYFDGMLDHLKTADMNSVFREDTTSYSSAFHQYELRTAADEAEPATQDDYDRDIAKFTKANTKAQNITNQNKDQAVAELLELQPAKLLTKMILHRLRHTHYTKQLLSTLGLPAENDVAEATKALTNWALVNKTQLTKAFAALCLTEHPAYAVEYETAKCALDRPQWGHYENGRKLTEAELAAKYAPADDSEEGEDDDD